MGDQPQVDFAALTSSDLYIDTIYKGGCTTSVVDDPLPYLLGVGNVGGFRFLRGLKDRQYKLVILYSSLSDPNWPDYLDLSTGTFTYYGDNKNPGNQLGENKPGNQLLQRIYESLHASKREHIPPFLIFTKGPERRDAIFRGLAAPGANGISMTDDLDGVWKSRNGQRFQNYKALFTILDEGYIKRDWIEDCKQGNFLSKNCPENWRQWVNSGSYNALRAVRTVHFRNKTEQLPNFLMETDILNTIYEYFKENPYAFEKFAAALVQMMDPKIQDVELTRPWVDGGRDAVGKYRIGLESDPIYVDFALEAKCYAMNSAVGVKETSRLISRLRHRQFGILVTTSFVHHQAYKEIRDDEHPVVIISSIDIVNILRRNGKGNLTDLQNYLATFPL